MSDLKYYSVVTDIGRAQIANALLMETQIELTHMAVGDGNGSEVLPKGSETQLANEVYRGPVNYLGKVANDPAQIIAKLIILPNVGGFTVREAGLFDVDGNLIIYCSLPSMVKPVLPEGTGMDLTVAIQALVGNAIDVVLKIDPGQTIASLQNVSDAIAAHDADADAHEAAFGQHDADAGAHAAAISKHNSNASAHAALMEAHNADTNANSAAIAKHNADPNAHSSNDLTQWIDCGTVTRVSNDQIKVTGDQSAKFPQGKLLRFNSADTTKCRVLGPPVVSGGVTTIQVWFEAKQNVPATISKLERSPLPPYATAYTGALATTTQYDEAMRKKLKDSYCYSAIVIKGA